MSRETDQHIFFLLRKNTFDGKWSATDYLVSQKMITKLHVGFKISNVEFASDGHVYFTGWDHVWRIPLSQDLLELKNEL